MLHYRRGPWTAAAFLCALCLAQTGCESLRNHPLSGDHPPSVPWENTRLSIPQDSDRTAPAANDVQVALAAAWPRALDGTTPTGGRADSDF